MRVVAVLVAMTVAAVAGVALFVLRDESQHESAPPITLAEPLPPGSVVAAVTGIDDAPLVVAPGAVIELKYSGEADDDHPPCATLQVLVNGRWTTTHWLGSAFGEVSIAGSAIWGDATWDRAVAGSDTTIVCPLMDMIGAGPERFRLPLVMPEGQMRLCRGDEICVDLTLI